MSIKKVAVNFEFGEKAATFIVDTEQEAKELIRSLMDEAKAVVKMFENKNPKFTANFQNGQFSLCSLWSVEGDFRTVHATAKMWHTFNTDPKTEKLGFIVAALYLKEREKDE